MTTTSLLTIARSWRWLILVAGILGGAAGYLLGQVGADSATATLPVAVSDDGIDQAGGTGYGVDELRQVVAAMISSTATLDEVAARSGVSPSGLSISAESDTRSPVVTVVVDAASPEEALAAAAVVPQVVAEGRQRLFVEHHRGDPAGPAASLDSDADAAPGAADLDAMITAAGSSVRALDDPSIRRTTPTAPISSGLGALAGATAGFGIAVLTVDRRRERAPWRSGLLPHPESWELDEREEPNALLMAEQGSAVPVVRDISLEAYDWILDRILSPSVNVIAVAGADREDGTGLTAVALAFAHANRGRPVVLMSLGISPSASSADELTGGLDSVIEGRATLADSLIKLESNGTMFYLPPGDSLGAEWTQNRVRGIREQIDLALRSDNSLIVLELPPVLSLDDPRPLLELADGIVVSSVRRMTDGGALASTRRWIDRSGTTLLGEVVHRDQLSRPLFVRKPASGIEDADWSVA